MCNFVLLNIIHSFRLVLSNLYNTLNEPKAILDIAKKTITMQSEAVQQLATLLDDDFSKAVAAIISSQGRVVVSGIGKSAIVASKITATLNSTGTPAIFMHAGDAIHGDLGTIQENDVVICISKSGSTPEIKMLVPLIKRGKNILIGMTGNPESFLGQQSDFVLNTFVAKEACPNNLAPTTSTTAQMVMGDALAICLLELKGFSSKDFAKYHPGGTLGKRLYLRVADIVATNQKPEVTSESDIKNVIVEISEKMLGATAVTENGNVVGVVTDGDVRRMLNKYDSINGLKAKDIMTHAPQTIESDVLALTALERMHERGISQLLVVDNNQYQGVVHLHNLLKEGIL